MNNCEGLFEFLRQFKVLAWKNALLKKRQWVILLIEIIVPVGVIIGLGQLRSISGKGYKAQKIPSTVAATVSSINEMYIPPTSCSTSSNLVWKCSDSCNVTSTSYAYTNYTGCAAVKIGVAPKYFSDATAVAAAHQFIDYMNNVSIGAQQYSTFQFWSSESKIMDYLEGADYTFEGEVYSAVVIFKTGYPSWEYSLRMNRTISSDADTYTPPTNVPNLDISLKSADTKASTTGLPYATAYVRSGYIALADTVNSYILTETCKKSGKCSTDETVTIDTAGTVNFPTPKVLVNQFWGLVGTVFALLMILALEYPLANVIRALVQEKETKLREGMAMMAMRGDALWFSWIFHFMCLFLPLSIILTLVGGVSLFTYSQGFYIFVYFMVFFISATSYCILVSTVFNRAIIAAIIGCVVFFGGYFITIGIVDPTRGQIFASCLHPAACFAYGTLAFAEYEDAQIGINDYTWNVSNKYPFTFQDVLNMMFIDAIWMGVLAWYIAQVWPSEFGTHKPWYFLFMPSYWLSNFQWITSGSSATVHDSKNSLNNSNDAPVEPVTENLSAQVAANKCVDIQNLYKEFKTSTGMKVAVDGLNLTMYSGQITALLGHNGAGKTTAISMLTGLIPPDGGKAIIEGLDIRNDMQSIRRNLGVCPQHDIVRISYFSS